MNIEEEPYNILCEAAAVVDKHIPECRPVAFTVDPFDAESLKNAIFSLHGDDLKEKDPTLYSDIASQIPQGYIDFPLRLRLNKNCVEEINYLLIMRALSLTGIRGREQGSRYTESMMAINISYVLSGGIPADTFSSYLDEKNTKRL